MRCATTHGLANGKAAYMRVRQDLRYIVIPARPEGTEGWSEAELAALVTRDSMLGVTRVRGPTPRVA